MGNRSRSPPGSSSHHGGALDLDLRRPAEHLHQQGDAAVLGPEADTSWLAKGPSITRTFACLDQCGVQRDGDTNDDGGAAQPAGRHGVHVKPMTGG